MGRAVYRLFLRFQLQCTISPALTAIRMLCVRETYTYTQLWRVVIPCLYSFQLLLLIRLPTTMHTFLEPGPLTDCTSYMALGSGVLVWSLGAMI